MLAVIAMLRHFFASVRPLHFQNVLSRNPLTQHARDIVWMGKSRRCWLAHLLCHVMLH